MAIQCFEMTIQLSDFGHPLILYGNTRINSFWTTILLRHTKKKFQQSEQKRKVNKASTPARVIFRFLPFAYLYTTIRVVFRFFLFVFMYSVLSVLNLTRKTHGYWEVLMLQRQNWHELQKTEHLLKKCPLQTNLTPLKAPFDPALPTEEYTKRKILSPNGWVKLNWNLAAIWPAGFSSCLTAN